MIGGGGASAFGYSSAPMRRMLRQGDRQIWFGNPEPPYVVDLPFGGEGFLLLLTWTGPVPAALQKEAFARRMIQAGAHEIVLAGPGSDDLSSVFEWASAARFPNLEVPAGSELIVSTYESAPLVEVMPHVARIPKAGTRRLRHVLVLALGAKATRAAEIERLIGTAFAAGSSAAGTTPTDLPGTASWRLDAIEVAGVAAAKPVPREHDHALYFAPGRWRFTGAAFDGNGVETPILGRLEVVQSLAAWTVDSPIGAARLTVRLPPVTNVARTTSWHGECLGLGPVEGHWVVAGDSVITTFVHATSTANGVGFLGSELAIRRSAAFYEVRGAVVEQGRLLTAWRGELRRATEGG